MSSHFLIELKLHQKTRTVEITFSNGKKFVLSCYDLRSASPSAEAKYPTIPVSISQKVNIIAIEPVGHYGVKLIFDDGHTTGIYSWEKLYELGERQIQS